MSTTYRIGPAVILTSASVSDPLSDWTEIHRTRGGITVTMPDSMVARGRTNEHMAPLAAWYAPGQATVSYKMVNRDIATMAAQVHRSTAMSASAKQALKIDAKLAAITPVSVAIVPLSEYNDDKQFLGAANAVVFEKAVFRVGEMASTVDVETDDLDGYMVTVESVNGVVTVGYPEVGMPELNPQGLLFLWQPSIDAVTPLVGEGAGTFTRATTATYVDDNGVIQSVASGQPRYQDGGLLLEPQRTNLIPLHNQLAGSGGATVTTGQASPDGGFNATLVTEDNSTGNHYDGGGTVTVVAGSVYTYSVYLKAGTGGVGIIGGEFNDAYIKLNLTAGTITASGGKDYLSSGIVALNSTWYRVWMVFTADVDNGFHPIVSPGDTPGSYTGNGVNSITYFGAQLELGSYPTSYIPTSGTTVTRNADALTIPFTTGLPADGLSSLWKGIFKSTPSTNALGMRIGAPVTTESDEYRLMVLGSGGASYHGPSGLTVVTSSGGPSFSTDTEDDIVAQVDVANDTIRTFNSSDVAQSTAAVFASSTFSPADGVISRNTSEGASAVATAMIVTKGLLTPAQLRRILR